MIACLILWNNGLVTALSTKSFAESLADATWWGRLVENAVGAHLCNTLAPSDYDVTYWRRGTKEVDFVVCRAGEVWAIEVKSGRSGKSTGLAHFKNQYSDSKTLLVGEGGVPLEDFFSQPAAAWLE